MEEETKQRASETIADRLYRAELAITGLESDPQILAELEPMGYNSERRAKGRALLENAQQLLTSTGQARATQKTLTRQAEQAEQSARSAYGDLSRIARAIFPGEPAALAHLGLDKGRVPFGTAAFLRAADNLFASAENAPQSIKDRLAEFGYNAAKLAAEKEKIAAFHTVNQRQEQAKGDAQNLAPQQQQALDDLDDYVMQLRKIARVALKSRPQLLEKMGVKA